MRTSKMQREDTDKNRLVAIVLVLGVALLVAIGVGMLQIRAANRMMASGRQRTAVVVSKEESHDSKGNAYFLVKFAYSVDGREFSGSDYVDHNEFNSLYSGERIFITYWSSNPKISSYSPNQDLRKGWGVIYGSFFIAFLGFIAFRIRRSLLLRSADSSLE